MNKRTQNGIYEFEDFRLDAAHLLLYQGGREIALTPKVVEILLALVRRSGEVLSKDELMEIVWPDSFVEEGNLTQNLYILRKTLSNTVDGKPLIETLKRRGYRFNGVVSYTGSEVPENDAAAAGETSPVQADPLENAAEPAARQTDEQQEPDDGWSRLTENLPAIVGREKEISQLRELLSQKDVRLVTLAGVGGAGKTRLARAAAQEMSGEFADGVFFIELAAITNAELVVPSIAQQFGITEAGGKLLLESLLDRLRGQKMLIVVDNFEQVIEAAPVITKLLAGADGFKLLMTSRALLNLSAEREYIVPPLAVPDDVADVSPAELANYEAVRLFVERARAAKPNFALTDENVFEVANICVRLDGLPLAIELAAARIKIISPRVILANLENSLKLLTGGASDLPARQQTMRGTIEWSYELLTENEKRLFRRLAVFAGGFTFEAAEDVCRDREESGDEEEISTAERIELLDIMTGLIDKSLLTAKDRASDEQRFQMLETVREYALELLEKNDEAETLRNAHASYFLTLAQEAEPHLNAGQAGEWLGRLEDEHNNLRAAMRRLFASDPPSAAEMAAAIRIYLINHCHLSEGREWLTKSLEENDGLSGNLRFKLFNGIGFLAFYQGDYAAAQTSFQDDLKEGRQSGDKRRIAESLRGLGIIAYSQSEPAAARRCFEEALAINRESGYIFGIAASLNSLGSLALDEGETLKARALFEESLMNFRLLGSENGRCFCLINLGAAAYLSGDFAAARNYYAETITIAQSLGYKDRVSLCLDGFAALAVKGEDWPRAARLAGAAEHLREQIGYEPEPIDRQRRNAYLAELEGKVERDYFHELYEEGCRLKLNEAISLCLADIEG